MELDEGMRRKIAVSVAVVAAFIASVFAIGTVYGGTALSGFGGLVLVGALAVFVLLMAAVGVYLAQT